MARLACAAEEKSRSFIDCDDNILPSLAWNDAEAGFVSVNKQAGNEPRRPPVAVKRLDVPAPAKFGTTTNNYGKDCQP
jgi:hypothetical protein